jgi:hypothetical protein
MNANAKWALAACTMTNYGWDACKLLYISSQCAKKIIEWDFGSKLWRPKELASHLNNTRKRVINPNLPQQQHKKNNNT